jgi:competence protein ComEC
MPRPLALALAVPAAAQLACQPVLFLLAPQVTPYTLPANLLAEPAAALVSVLG